METTIIVSNIVVVLRNMVLQLSNAPIALINTSMLLKNISIALSNTSMFPKNRSIALSNMLIFLKNTSIALSILPIELAKFFVAPKVDRDASCCGLPLVARSQAVEKVSAYSGQRIKQFALK